MDREPSLARRVVVSVLGVALALGLGAMALRALAGMRRPPAKTAGGAPLPVVRVERVDASDHREVIRGYGTVRALVEARVSAEIAGVVTEVSPGLRVGARVAPPPDAASSQAPTRVDPLVAIDARDLEDERLRLAAERTQTEAEQARIATEIRTLAAQAAVLEQRLATARAEEERIARLVPRTLTESDLDRQRLTVLALEQSRTELDARRDLAVAQTAMLDARLEALDVAATRALRDVGRTRVFAPLAGVVTARHVEEGDRVAPGTRLFDVLDPSRVEVAVALPGSRHADVAPGHAIRLGLRHVAPPLVETRIARVAPRVDPESRTFLVFVELVAEGEAAPWVPGTHVVAEADGPLYRDVLPVPREAFLGEHVFVVREGTGGFVARQRRPRIRALLPGVALVVPGDGPEDLESGDVVVVSNLEDITEGSRLKPLPRDADQAAR